MKIEHKTVLLFCMDTDKGKRIADVCGRLEIRARYASGEEEKIPLGLLAGADGWLNPLLARNSREAMPVTEEMLVLAGFSDGELEYFLAELRRQRASVSLKAVLTEQNAVWNAMQLQGELKQERAAFLNALPRK